MTTAPETITEDAFLGGRVRALQPGAGFRSGADAVFLAACVAAKRGDKVLDVGCGAGVAGLCLAARISGIELHGLEAHEPYADLAAQNGVGTVWRGDLFAPAAALKEQSFDWVLTNPPYFTDDGPRAPDLGRAGARTAERPVADWIAACLKRLKPGGGFAMIHQISAAPEVLSALKGAGDIAMLPLQPRPGRNAKRFLLTARKGAKGPFRLSAPLILHDGERHERDGDGYSVAADRILRSGAPLSL